MQHAIEFKGFEPQEKIRQLVEDRIVRLEKKGKRLPQDSLFLRIVIEQRPVHVHYDVSAILATPGKTLAARQDGNELEQVIRRAIDEIERQLLDHKAVLQGELDWEIRRSKSERRREVHIEEDIPETPPTEAVSTLGEEILYFYQPDEDLKLEDVVPDVTVPAPEDEVAAKEMRLSVRRALRAMPNQAHRLLWLRYVQRFSIPQLARAANLPETEVEPELERARDFLRRRLIEAGCRADAKPLVRTSSPA